MSIVPKAVGESPSSQAVRLSWAIFSLFSQRRRLPFNLSGFQQVSTGFVEDNATELIRHDNRVGSRLDVISV